VASSLESLTHGWVVLQLTNSPVWVGVAAGIRGVTQSVFSIPLGAVGDRVDRRRILMITQVLGAVAMSGIWMLLVTHTLVLWHMLVLSAFLGLTASLERPAANGVLYEVVSERWLLNASAFRQMGSSLVRAGGALAGGLIIESVGPAGNYFLAVPAHLASLACLLFLRYTATNRRVVESFARSVAEGLRYVLRTPQVRRLMLLSLSIESFGFSYSSMLPVMARDILRVSASGLGALSAANGIGQLCGTFVVAWRGREENKGRFLIIAALGFGFSIIVFGLSPWFLASVFVAAVIGAMGSSYDTAMAAVLLTSSAAEMRGRVLGLYFSTVALSHAGGFITAALAALVGVPFAVAAGGAVVAASALALLTRIGTTPR
jgi:MFS family permease